MWGKGGGGERGKNRRVGSGWCDGRGKGCREVVWVSVHGWGWAGADRLHESGCNHRMGPGWSGGGDMGRGWWVLHGTGLELGNHGKPKELVDCGRRRWVDFGKAMRGRIKLV